MARGDKSARNIAKKKRRKKGKRKRKRRRRVQFIYTFLIYVFSASRRGIAFNTVVISTNTFTRAKRREIECVQE